MHLSVFKNIKFNSPVSMMGAGLSSSILVLGLASHQVLATAEILHIDKTQEAVRLAQADPAYAEAQRRIQVALETQATALDLSWFGLRILPPEIGQLTNLQSLFLEGNLLSSLPPEIGQLTNLQSLILDRNQLSSLPPEIGQLTNLQGIKLSYNGLTGLPSEIGQLTNIQGLYLRLNKFTS
ncbi:MAG: leucine-rich repeat domain-containing protein [Leptolyngbyaceae cyanobacterium]